MKRKGLWFLVCLCLVSLTMVSCLSDDDDATDDDDDTTDDDDDATDDDDDATDDDDDTTDDDDDTTDDDDDDTPPSPYDPLPDAKDPGEYECEGCPDSDLQMEPADFLINAGDVTTYEFMNGSPLSAVTGNDKDGEWYLVQKDVDEPKENWGTVYTDEYGAFSVTVPLFCGGQLFKIAWSNENGTYGVVFFVETTDCLDDDIRATLSWGAGAYDLELHLIREGGQLNVAPDDCTWTNMNPDWGVEGDELDNPSKDVDDTGDNGLENILLSRPEDIKYRVMVEYWGSGEPIDPTLVLMMDGQIVTKTLANFSSHYVWDAAILDWPNRTITWLTSDPSDCSTSWSSGCTAELPVWE